jgi:hypothetical protein
MIRENSIALFLPVYSRNQISAHFRDFEEVGAGLGRLTCALFEPLPSPSLIVVLLY